MNFFQRAQLKREIDQALLEGVETTGPTSVSPVSVDDIRAAIASTKLPRRTLIVHPDIDNFAVIKAEAAKLSLDVVRGSRAMKPGEAYIVMGETSFIKKEP